MWTGLVCGKEPESLPSRSSFVLIQGLLGFAGQPGAENEAFMLRNQLANREAPRAENTGECL
jgi:hypothetical protein